MIPKKIHYCWIGGTPLPKSAQKCIASWKKYCPDYEIIEWNENNFNVNEINYTKEAYKMKKYAFVSDYARLKILYEEGGIYFDTDVEVLKKFDEDILENGYFAKEIDEEIATGLGFAVPPHNKCIKYMLDDYLDKKFIDSNGKMIIETCTRANTKSLANHGYIVSEIDNLDGIKIYDKNYFCGFDVNTNHYIISDKTYTVHHYAASWGSKSIRFKRFIKKTISKIIGIKIYNRIRDFKLKFRKKKG